MENYTFYLIHILLPLLLAWFISTAIRKRLSHKLALAAERLDVDPTNFSFMMNSIGFLTYNAAFLYIFLTIPTLRHFGNAIFAGAGILAAIVGFASQKAFSNIVSGVFILIFKPFKIRDTIEFQDGKKGIVEEITLRHTIIKDYENRRIIIPNSIISEQTIINSCINDTRIRLQVVFSISYEASIDHAMQLIQDEALKHKLTLDNRSELEITNNEPIVAVRVVNLGDFSVDLKAYIWAQGNDNAFNLKFDLLKAVKERFQLEGIEIPYPHHVVIKK